ncbi:uncharacterized protein LOC100907240 isoform X1 [Galendromus occidentalis]|uniref:peptidylprolyl isomerase n=1 Tax=Galendromus occidentalis TaxID=34638 RepID=A0AAJ7L4T0_9ACAR|nr:uncharacterized protein LOC100907240 isoform X1 [Galendromus occidentalis]
MKAIFLLASIALCAAAELKVDVLQEATCERKSKKGDSLTMHYTGTLEKDGSKFDSSLDRGEPFQFQLGVGQVIKGWDQGLEGMCVGEKRKLTIPAELGYGERGAGDKIPPGSNLVFEVELLKIEEGPKTVNIFKEIDSNSDQQLSKDEVSTYLKVCSIFSKYPGVCLRTTVPDVDCILAYRTLRKIPVYCKNKTNSEALQQQLPAAQAAGMADLPETEKMVADIFDHEDTDHNGFISHAEFSGPKHDEL